MRSALRCRCDPADARWCDHPHRSRCKSPSSVQSISRLSVQRAVEGRCNRVLILQQPIRTTAEALHRRAKRLCTDERRALAPTSEGSLHGRTKGACSDDRGSYQPATTFKVRRTADGSVDAAGGGAPGG